MPDFVRILTAGVALAAVGMVSPPASASGRRAQEKLRFALVLSRHGIRSPLDPTSTLNLRSSNPWPEWEVPPGKLTPHGAIALREMGSYMHSEFVCDGLILPLGCPPRREIYLYSDRDERNIESTRSTFAGFLPGCQPLPVNTMIPTAGIRDPLFSPFPGTFPAPSAGVLATERQRFLRDRESPYFVPNEESIIVELAHVLTPEGMHPAAKPILEEASPLAAASPLIEDIFLEYADGKPMSDVGWGRVSELSLRQLIPLHVRQFASTTRTPLASAAQGSDLLAHILDTLERAAGQSSRRRHKSIGTPIGPKDALLVYISGHDTNLFNIGGLLGLHWTVNGITDEIPPDSQIVFELWQSHRSKEYTLRLRYRAQTIDQLRTASPLTRLNRPVEVELTPTGCKVDRTCLFATFDDAARARLNPAYIKKQLESIEPAPTN